MSSAIMPLSLLKRLTKQSSSSSVPGHGISFITTVLEGMWIVKEALLIKSILKTKGDVPDDAKTVIEPFVHEPYGQACNTIWGTVHHLPMTMTYMCGIGSHWRQPVTTAWFLSEQIAWLQWLLLHSHTH